MIEILSNGGLNLVQDSGRVGHLAIGVSRGGAMDGPALALANVLVGNEPDAAAIEIGIFPFRVRFARDTYIACTGAVASAELAGRNLPTWWAAPVRAGELLAIAPPQRGARSYLAVAGGIDVPRVLGSRSTDVKGGFGGFEGRGLRKGDVLEVGPSTRRPGTGRRIGIVPAERMPFSDELASGCVTVRVLPAAEYDNFTEEAIAAFLGTEYRLTPRCNRQGYRLAGAPLQSRQPLELLSHGVVPGTVQVPPDGQPIIQLAEANTCGGYSKIATVIEADLWRVGQLGPGMRLRFALTDIDAAITALQAQAADEARIRNSIALVAASR